jgi:osmotically-inducible protein OsmY
MKSDDQLHLEIRFEIEKQRGNRSGEVDLKVLRSNVTLTGTAQSDSEQWHLRDAIRSLAGVARLEDQTLISPGPSTSSNWDVARPWFRTD